MSEGVASLEQKIERFENLLEEMREEIREAHSVLKETRKERREINKMLNAGVKELVHARVDMVVRTELDKIGPEIRQHTNFIYARVGREIDTLIRLSLGTELSQAPGHEDVRPALAAKLREWIDEILANAKDE